MVLMFVIMTVTVGPIVFFTSRPAIGTAKAARMTLLVLCGYAMFLGILELAPEPYDDLLPVVTVAGLVGLGALGHWKASRQAATSQAVHTLRRTTYQRHALWSAAFLGAVLVWGLIDELRAGGPSSSEIYLLALGLVVMQLLTGTPKGRITESGILVHGTLFRWGTLKNPEWLHGEAATLAYTVEQPGRVLQEQLTFHPGDVAPVTAALTRYAGYSPITGS